MLMIFLVPVVGIFFAIFVHRLFPRAQFNGYDLLPFFFIPACNLITNYKKLPSFLPYGFLLFFVLAIVIAISAAVKAKNISLPKTLHQIWGSLSLCSVMWYIGLIFILIA